MKRKPSRSCDERYRHKLNMLGPGTVMLRICAVLTATGGLCFGLSWPIAATILFTLACLLLLVLLGLICIELHQDRVLNELAARENQNRGDCR